MSQGESEGGTAVRHRTSITLNDMEAAGLGELFDSLRTSVADNVAGWSPNIAVLSEPFAGRHLLMDTVESAVEGDVRRLTFDAVVSGDLPNFEGEDVVLLDDCHYLYTREIGGFDRLDRLLELISASDALFVTSWNKYAWDYLVAVRDIDDVFSTNLAVPSLTADQIRSLVLSNYADSVPEFVFTGAGGRVKTIGFDHRDVALPGGKQLSFAVPELNLEYLLSRSLSKDEEVEDAEAVVFQKLAQLSNGNPGVATVLWERSIRDGQIAPAYIEEVDQNLDIDDDEAFVLEVLLAKERLSRSTMEDVLDDIPVHRALLSLSERDVLRIDEDHAVIDPEYLYAVDTHLKGRRLIW